MAPHTNLKIGMLVSILVVILLVALAICNREDVGTAWIFGGIAIAIIIIDVAIYLYVIDPDDPAAIATEPDENTVESTAQPTGELFVVDTNLPPSDAVVIIADQPAAARAAVLTAPNDSTVTDVGENTEGVYMLVPARGTDE